MTSVCLKSYPDVTLPDLIGTSGIFVDGDWVESKDQDKNGEVRLIQLADVGVGKYLNKSNRFMTLISAKSLKCTFLKPGDILIARMPDPLGRACIFPGDEMPCVTVVDVCIFRPETGLADSNWLVHMINSQRFRNEISTWVTGTTRQRISRGNLSNLRFPLPPLDEQRRIAAILDKADAIRRKRQESIRLTEEFLRSTFLEMFGDPVTNPKGWETKKLEDLITVQGGYAFKSGDYTDKGVPLVRIGTANKKDFDVSNIVFLPSSFAETYSRFLLSPGDMVITLTGTAGKDDYGNVNIVPDIYSKWLLNQRVAKIIATSNLITKAYLFTFLSDANVKDNMISNNRGIRQGNLNNTDILSQMLPLPPIGLQEKFSEITSNIQLLRMKESQQFDVSQQFFSSLTHRAFRGEL